MTAPKIHSRVVSFLLVAALSFSSYGCDNSVTKRPMGYIRLGKVTELTSPEQFFSEQGLLLRRDSGGLYVMSTLYPYDLSPLNFVSSAKGRILVSTPPASSYSVEGDVLSGPIRAELPYYELRLDRGEYNGPVDTLYAYVGAEKPRSWRLKP